jgi:ribonuclease P protein component
MNTACTFGKTERLSRRKDIDVLFSHGLSFNLSTLKVIYLLLANKEDVPVKVIIGIPKKKIRLAVHRNRLRRLIKEAYRLHKHRLVYQMNDLCCSLHIGFLYTSDRPETAFSEIEKQMITCLDRLAGNITGMKNHTTGKEDSI